MNYHYILTLTHDLGSIIMWRCVGRLLKTESLTQSECYVS